MSSRLFMAFLAASVPLCAGIWASLVGFGYIGKPPGAELIPGYQLRRRIYRIGGPIVLVLGLWLGVQPFIAPGLGLAWEKYSPADAHFSVDMPGSPQEAAVDETGKYGAVTNHVARVFLSRLDLVCTFRYTPLPKDFPELNRDQIDDWLKELVEQIARVNRGKVASDKELPYPDAVARQFRIDLQNGYVFRGQILILGQTQFQLHVIGPADLAFSDIANRFLGSFDYRAPAEGAGENKESK